MEEHQVKELSAILKSRSFYALVASTAMIIGLCFSENKPLFEKSEKAPVKAKIETPQSKLTLR